MSNTWWCDVCHDRHDPDRWPHNWFPELYAPQIALDRIRARDLPVEPNPLSPMDLVGGVPAMRAAGIVSKTVPETLPWLAQAAQEGGRGGEVAALALDGLDDYGRRPLVERGPKRRRVPAIWDVDTPLVSGVVQNQDAYMQATAGQRPYFFDHIEAIADACMDEYAGLTGRRYQRVAAFKAEDADYLRRMMAKVEGMPLVALEEGIDWDWDVIAHRQLFSLEVKPT